MPRNTELADDEDVERRAKGMGDFVADGNAAAGKSQDDRLGIRSQRSRKLFPEKMSGLDSISEHVAHRDLLRSPIVPFRVIAPTNASSVILRSEARKDLEMAGSSWFEILCRF